MRSSIELSDWIRRLQQLYFIKNIEKTKFWNIAAIELVRSHDNSDKTQALVQ